jgi:hypothetical protein
MRNIKQFGSICGNNLRYALVVVTTMWNNIGESDAVRREKELMSDRDFLRMFLEAKVKFERHPPPDPRKTESDSARDVIRHLLDPKNAPKSRGFLWRLFNRSK